MAVDLNNTAIGAAVISIGDYVTAGGAGTLTDVGLTTEAAELNDSAEHYDLMGEQAQGILRRVPTGRTVTLKIPCAEVDIEKLRRVLRQAAANKTGTTPNFTLGVDAESEVYLQVQLVTKGVTGSTGTVASRTFTFWKCAIDSRDAMLFAKGEIQKLVFTVTVLQDLSITAGGDGQFYEVADSGAA